MAAAPPSKHRTRFPKFFFLIVPLLSIFGTLLAAELLVGLVRPVPFSNERNMYFDPDPHTGFRNHPNSVGHYQNGIVAETNNHGHRDRAASREKPDGVFRILALGDSFTVGRNVRQQEAYPEVLEELLNRNRTMPVEVLNSGVGGWEPFQYAQYFLHYGRQFDADLILVGFFVGNDTLDQTNSAADFQFTARMGRRISKKAAASSAIDLKIFLYERSHLARMILNREPVSYDFERKDCEDFSGRYLGIQKRRLKNHLVRDSSQEQRAMNGVRQIARIEEAAREDRAAVLVVLIPDEMQVNPAARERVLGDAKREVFDFLMPQSFLIERLRAEGIETIDLRSAFVEDPRCLYMNDAHWTPEGHRLAADRLATRILADGYIDGSVAGPRPAVTPP